MANVTFSDIWDKWNNCHQLSEQLERQNRALDKMLTPLSINFDNNSGIFKGTKGQYNTSLESCSCKDFSHRNLPCKHMYRLAHELGAFQLPGQVHSLTPDEVTRLNKEEAMQLIQKTLTPDEQRIFGYFCYHCGNNNNSEQLFSKNMSEKLLQAKLACEVTDVAKLLKYLHIKEIRKLLPPNTKSPRTKADLIALVAPLVTKEDIVFPDEQKCLTLHPCISHLGHTIHRQICAMYPEEPTVIF